MKRIISALLIICIFAAFTSITAFADSGDTSVVSSTVITYEDGSYCVITLTESPTRSSTKSGTKTKTFYDSSNNLDWKVTLTGTFSFDGSTSTCTNASCSVNIYDTAWYNHSKSASRSGNKAIGNAVMKKSVLGIVTTRNVDLELSCDKNGVLS